jgi:ATP-dependent Lhr-like helicase
MESQTGNVFQLGNASWRILYVRGGEVTVRDAHGAPATVPFWLGEAPGRTPELSQEFSELREQIWQQAEKSGDTVHSWLQQETGASDWAAQQAVGYVSAQGAAIGVIPSQRRVVFERFFDESGGMQLVIHAPFGARINRAWGLALRKCFCRNFDFELQAIADDNGIVLAMGPQQSFPLEQMFALLEPSFAESVLIQALLAAPMFGVRWRWNVTRALAVLRQRGGKKVPPYLQRFRAEDLLTAVFPMQTACFEHRTGDLEPPDHPLVRQTVHDCLHEVMDFAGWMEILGEIESGRIELIGKDTREPSPFSHQLVNSNVYTFLDDAPIEERRARAVAVRRTFRPDDVRDLGRLDAEAIAQVRTDARPIVRDADELHDLLLSTGAMPESECGDWLGCFSELTARQRAVRRELVDGPTVWIATERWPIVNAALGLVDNQPPDALPESLRSSTTKDGAYNFLVRGRLEIVGPTTCAQIAADLGMCVENAQIALEQLELSGFVLRGHFTPGAAELEWCERRLLARIHRQTLDRLRRQIEPVDATVFTRFLLEYHGIACENPSAECGLKVIIGRLEGFEAPLGAWEHDLLPARLTYDPPELDRLFTNGDVLWGRLDPPQMNDDSRGKLLTRVTPISLVQRSDLSWLLPPKRDVSIGAARWDAQTVYEALKSHGALFFSDLLSLTNLMPSQLDDALRELAALGMVTADGFAAIRAVSGKSKDAVGRRIRKVRSRRSGVYSHAGRWSLFPPFVQSIEDEARTEKWAWLLLKRYGVMFRDLVGRESLAPSWGELARVYRRLEMRGEIRGGRFVAGVGGEQFALPEAIERLRKLRDEPQEESWAVVSAVDPLNVVGVLTKDARVPALRGNRIVFCNGRPIAAREAREIRWLSEVDGDLRFRAERLLKAPGALGRTALTNHRTFQDFELGDLDDIAPARSATAIDRSL